MTGAQLTVYWFATGHYLGWVSANSNFIKVHNTLIEWMEYYEQ